jgi:hypothetical protein
MSDGTPPEDSAESQPINAPLAGLVHQAESAPGRRRQAIVAGVVSVAVAAAMIVYVVDQRRFQSSLSKIELPDVAAKRAAAPTSTGPALDLAAPSASPLAAGASSPKATSPPPSPELENSPVRNDIEKGTEWRDPTAANPAPSGSRTVPSCSDSASALGLCDAEISSSTRRQ